MSSPLAFASAIVLALGAGACAAGGGSSAPAGFSTAFTVEVDGDVDAGAADGGVGDAGDAADGDAGVVPSLRAIAGSGAGSAWAVGEGGLAVELVDGKFHVVETGSTATLAGLSALDVSHAFAVELGGARVLGWDGARWSPVGAARADRAAAATWAASTKDVWVAGDGVEHWDGTAWTAQIPSGTSFSSLSGSFRTDVWTVGAGGVQRFDGTSWKRVATPAGAGAVAAVWSASQFETWIVGAQGTVLLWNGATLSRVVTSSTADLTCVTGTGQGDVWAGGTGGALLHWDGTAWTPTYSPSGRTINGVWTAVSDDVYFVDDTGTIGRYVR